MTKFLEIKRVYINNPYSHEMLLNIDTIMKIEPISPSEDKPGNIRIVLDRKNEDNTYMVLYAADLYSSVSSRMKSLRMSGVTSRRKKK